MASFKLMTYATGEGPRAGLLSGDGAFDAAGATGEPRYESVMAILADWDRARGILGAFAAGAGASRAGALDRAHLRLLAPIPMPGTIYCAGANYRDHVLEMARAQNIQPEPDPHTLGLKAWHFIKSSRCVVAPDAVIPLPAHSKKVDWEAELGVVIGRRAKNVSVERALDVIAGYTIGNDLSARDVSRRQGISDTSPFKFDWVAQKCFDGACPLGPWIVPAEDVPDPHNLKIELTVNGVVKQSSNTSELIFDISEQIAHLSEKITLHPGDVILTGTPAGVGAGRGEFLKAGDEVRITIERVGELVNRFA
jgi:2-keto-4-pentenoate hydratase/2-oxohepta-3-ene-1,7-dioic acid hydratase in catechol pathway